MAVSLRWAGILLILLITSWKADAVEHGFYSALEPGQNITGKIEREIKTRTELECSTKVVLLLSKLNGGIYMPYASF